jgi:hypothetical protein
MNWGKVALAGIAGGICLDVANFVQHGLIMGNTYSKYPIFDVAPANPLMFVFVDILIGLTAAVLFARTRESWAGGAAGGLLYGILLGLVGFFPNFYDPLILNGFPYHLAWCWGGITLIGFAVMGTVLGLIYRRTKGDVRGL